MAASSATAAPFVLRSASIEAGTGDRDDLRAAALVTTCSNMLCVRVRAHARVPAALVAQDALAEETAYADGGAHLQRGKLDVASLTPYEKRLLPCIVPAGTYGERADGEERTSGRTIAGEGV